MIALGDRGDWADAGALLGILVRAIRAVRVLEIGAGDGRLGLAIAAALPPDGLLIVLERDPGLAARAREGFRAAGLADNASVMIGDAPRFLHKLAGPFDLIVQDGRELQPTGLIDGLVRLLAAAGTLISHNTSDADDYNRTLAAESRLTTVFVQAGNGVAISVKRQV